MSNDNKLEILKADAVFTLSKSAARRAQVNENNKQWHAEDALERKHKAEDLERKAEAALVLAKNKHAAAKKAYANASKTCADAHFKWAEARAEREAIEATVQESLKKLADLHSNLCIAPKEDEMSFFEQVIRTHLRNLNG